MCTIPTVPDRSLSYPNCMGDECEQLWSGYKPGFPPILSVKSLKITEFVAISIHILKDIAILVLSIHTLSLLR